MRAPILAAATAAVSLLTGTLATLDAAQKILGHDHSSHDHMRDVHGVYRNPSDE